MELIILVDHQDRQIGVEEKLAVHRNGGLLHRAFSIFIFNRRGEMLIQQRSAQKYHFRNLWTNACCGHPRPGEEVESSARRRLSEKLGFETALREVFSFVYSADDPESGLTEREFDHVFVGWFDGTVHPHPDEVSDVRWIARAELEHDLAALPDRYTVWFREALARLVNLAAWPSGDGSRWPHNT